MPTSSTRSAARTIRRPCSASTAQFDTGLDRDRPRRGAALDRRPGAARSRQSRHHPADRRRGRRRRADPDRRLRRPLLGRGGARVDGRAVHPEDRGRALGRVSSPGCAAARASWSAPASTRRADYQDARYASPTFLLVGNESQGLPPAYEAACDLLVKIPMLGKADSLNAAVAAAVMAYEVINQRRRRLKPRPCQAVP